VEDAFVGVALAEGLTEPTSARILAAACSATVTMYDVGFVVM
jgi:hypothetical protein